MGLRYTEGNYNIKGHISRGFHFAIRCHCLVDQSESGAGQAVVSYISRAHRLLI